MATSTPRYDQLTPQRKARIAYMRFGLGPKLDNAALLDSPDAAQKAVLAELNDPSAAIIPDSDVRYDGAPLTYAACCKYGASAQDLTVAPLGIYRMEAAARVSHHTAPAVGFLERLVLFWSNHFSVYAGKNPMVRSTVGHFERSVIRKHVLGKFSDMLKAAIEHPAMICYLDNGRSFGMNSPQNKSEKDKTKITYNENLAREILELHTVGFNGGYTQDDVTIFAKVLTGWTVGNAKKGVPGQFYFDPDMHEPGPKTIMQQSYTQGGKGQALAVLDMLAKHENTANHIATKLVKHFVSDKPDPRWVSKLRDKFLETDGDLLEIARLLATMDEPWTAPLNRLRQPYPWMVSIIRGLDLARVPKSKDPDYASDLQAFIGSFLGYMSDGLLGALNQPIWGRMTPDGYPEENFEWMSPNTVRLRRDAAMTLMYAIRSRGSVDAQGYATSKDKAVGSYVVPERPAPRLLTWGLPTQITDGLAAFGNDTALEFAMLALTPQYMRR